MATMELQNVIFSYIDGKNYSSKDYMSKHYKINNTARISAETRNDS